jgi:uncharacterized coiled-coil DUF342 family protein
MADVKPTEPATPVNATTELKAPPAIKKPDRNLVKDKEDKIRAQITKVDDKIKVISDKAKALQQAAGKDDGLTELRSKLKELKGKREVLTQQRTSIYGVRDAARESRDAKMSEMKDLKALTKYKDVGEVDRQIKKLETMQFTTTMSLSKEKEVLKEIEELKKQRRVLAQHMTVATDLDGGKASAVDASAQIKDINEKLSVIKGDMEKVQTELNKHYEKKNDSAYPALIKEKDELRATKKTMGDSIQLLWDDFKEANKVWKENQDEWDKYKKLLNAKEKEEYEARKEELRLKREEELAKKIPYEEEMDLCDYLSNYLTNAFMSKDKSTEKVVEEVKTDFDGLVLLNSKKDDGNFYMAPSGKQGKKNKGGGKKTAAGTKRGKIVIFPETLESFGLLKLDPPTTVDQVPGVIEKLAEKKAAFKILPRGAILSIAEMNQKFEADAESGGQRRDNKNKGGGSKKQQKQGAVDTSSNELFPSLGGGAKAAEEKE